MLRYVSVGSGIIIFPVNSYITCMPRPPSTPSSLQLVSGTAIPTVLLIFVLSYPLPALTHTSTNMHPHVLLQLKDIKSSEIIDIFEHKLQALQVMCLYYSTIC